MYFFVKILPKDRVIFQRNVFYKQKPRSHITICDLGFDLNGHENFAQILRQNLSQRRITYP